LTVKTLRWTQGVEFSFKVGDIIYDCKQAYEQWSKALQHIQMAIQISNATDATVWQFHANESVKSSAPTRHSGIVMFEVLRPNDDKSKLTKSSSHVLTQDEFVRFLITGEELTD
jgi:hypothetical protein